MNVRVRAVGVALDGLPDAAGGQALALPDGCRVADALRRLAPPDPAHLAVFVNGVQVHESELATTALAENDELILVRPIEGGCDAAR